MRARRTRRCSRRAGRDGFSTLNDSAAPPAAERVVRPMSHGTSNSSERRPLTDAEHALLRWLLTRGAEITGTDAKVAAAFLPQLGALQVVGRCACGCPTVDLVLGVPELAVPGVTTSLA